MYRQYEDPRALEKELESKRTDRAWLEDRIIHHNIDDNPIEELQEMLYDVCDQISELEQRVNFAWQDEEYDKSISSIIDNIQDIPFCECYDY